MNYSLVLVQEKAGRGCWKGKDKESSKWIQPVYMKGFFSLPPLTSISPALSTERELPGADKSPVICQTSPPCPALLFPCILLSVIESANSEKLLSIWIQSSTCETHSTADWSFFADAVELHTFVPRACGPDVRDNVTVKLQRKMVTAGKDFTAHILQCFLFCKAFNCGGQLLLPGLFGCVCVCLGFFCPWLVTCVCLRSLVATGGSHQ